MGIILIQCKCFARKLHIALPETFASQLQQRYYKILVQRNQEQSYFKQG